MYNVVLSRYFSNKAPKFLKKVKGGGKEAKAKAQPSLILPEKMEDAIKIKMDYQKSFVGAYDPDTVEKHWYEWWNKQGYFHCPAEEGKTVDRDKRYVIILPPPNVTGSLHIGHALTGAIEDCL